MKRWSLFAVPALICCLAWNSSVVFGQPKKPAADVKDPRVNRKIMITTAGAELRTPKATVWKAYIGEVFTINLTNGEWLWIGEKGGWLWEKDGVLLDSAITTFEKRIQKQKSAENYHLRGVAYLAQKQYDNAIADFTESLRRQPQNSGALNNRGQAKYLQGDYQAAIADYTEAIGIDAANPLVLNNRALAYLALDDLNNALTDLQAALKLIPRYPEALNNRGVVYHKLKEPDKAIADFTEALKIDPKYIDALGNRAMAYLEKSNLANAVSDLETAMKIDPHSYEAANDLAWLLATSQDDSVRNGKRVLEIAKRACAISEYKQWNTLDTLAVAYAENGQFAEAKQWLGTALTLAPDDEKEHLQSHLDSVMAEKPVRE